MTLSRPAKIISSERRLDADFRAARWAHHRLLDFEDAHQRVLDEAAEQAAPGIVRVGRILARLARRAKRAAHTPEGAWAPKPRPELAATLRKRLESLRKRRNADPRWKAALAWADEEVGKPKVVRRRLAKDPSKVKRRKTETDEAFAKRFELLTNDETDEHYRQKLENPPRDTRRDVYRKQIYKKRRCHHGTWNAVIKSVDQARRAVLKRRSEGLPAEWHRPKFRHPTTLAADMKVNKNGSTSGFRIVSKGSPRPGWNGDWWTVEMQIGTGERKEAEWVRILVKCSSWHDFDESQIKTAKLTRRRSGERWSYTLSLTVEDAQKKETEWATSGLVAFDWGHREHGHDSAAEGLRAFVWCGDDDQEGEVLVPRACREAADQIDAMKSRVDATFARRKATMKLPDRNRHGYRRRLMSSGVRTKEESKWLQWEMRYERRIMRRRKRIENLRREMYLQVVRDLRQKYARFAFEKERSEDIRQLQKEEERRRRIRSNRDLVTRYEFVSLCERFGAAITTVSARNTTRECPECGHLDENGPELLIVCSKCGVARDKDRGAARIILRRAQEALVNRAAE